MRDEVYSLPEALSVARWVVRVHAGKRCRECGEGGCQRLRWAVGLVSRVVDVLRAGADPGGVSTAELRATANQISVSTCTR